MPVDNYGVFIGIATEARREQGTGQVHYQVKAQAGNDVLRVAINVLSDSRGALEQRLLKYIAIDDFRHPVTDAIAALGDGWHPVAHAPGGAALDYIRGNLFAEADLRIMPPDVAGPDNDLEDLIEHYVARALTDDTIRIAAVGSRWNDTRPDQVFSDIAPSTGVHDIHMNQGNDSAHQGDDGIWNDGGLLIHLPSEQRWVAFFFAFQNQAFHTDDQTGHATTTPAPGGGGGAAADETPVRIIAAAVNPVGADDGETVLLINASPAAVDLTGWQVADRVKITSPVPGGPLAAGQTLLVPVVRPSALGNQGGIITLLDDHGTKISGVSYTAAQAQEEGWTVTF